MRSPSDQLGTGISLRLVRVGQEVVQPTDSRELGYFLRFLRKEEKQERAVGVL